jgi:hypothetical protein
MDAKIPHAKIFKRQKQERKEKEKTSSDEPTVP